MLVTIDLSPADCGLRYRDPILNSDLQPIIHGRPHLLILALYIIPSYSGIVIAGFDTS